MTMNDEHFPTQRRNRKDRFGGGYADTLAKDLDYGGEFPDSGASSSYVPLLNLVQRYFIREVPWRRIKWNYRESAVFGGITTE